MICSIITKKERADALSFFSSSTNRLAHFARVSLPQNTLCVFMVMYILKSVQTFLQSIYTTELEKEKGMRKEQG